MAIEESGTRSAGEIFRPRTKHGPSWGKGRVLSDDLKEIMRMVSLPRGISALIDESSNDTSEIAEAHMHCDANTAFKTATDVIAVPCHAERNEWVDPYREPDISCLVLLERHLEEARARLTTCGKEGADILHCRLATADEHGKPSDRQDLESDHEAASLLCLVGGIARADGKNACNDVRRNGHQLGTFVGVAHVPNNGGEEERDGVERRVDSDRDEHVHIDLPILKCLKEVFEIELVSERGAIVFESALDFDPFGLCKELGSIAKSVLMRAIIHQ